MIDEIIGGKYNLKAELGRGGTGIVYLAKELQTRQYYAIKTISTEDKHALKLLKRETDTLKRLSHDSIVKFVDDGYEDSHKLVYLVLEYLEGEGIQRYFERGVALKTKIDLFLQILDAVSHAHSKNVIHRDIKPDNIMVVEIGELPVAKILDFGISIITTTLLTNTISSYHTPLFAPLEQRELKGVSRDSDIYSLAMTYLYLLSTEKARDKFREEQNKEVLYESTTTTLNSASQLSNSLIDVLRRATEVERENRPKIDEIRKVLASLKSEVSEKLTIVFGITSALKRKISDFNQLDSHPLKVKKYIEDKLKNDSGTIYIQKIQGKTNKDNRLTVEIGVDSTSDIFRGFIDKDRPLNIILFDQLAFINPQSSERLFENGVAVRVEPIIDVSGNGKSGDDLSDLINDILQKYQQIINEKEGKATVDSTFSLWQNVIDIETKIVNERKQSFAYSSYEYDKDKQRLIISLTQPISLDELEKITSPPLPVTISVKKQSPPYTTSQWSVGDIIDGEQSKNGDLVEKLYISIGDFCNPDLFEALQKQGHIETNFKAEESQIQRRRKALRAIRYSDSENTNLFKILAEPDKSPPVEPLAIHQFFNQQLDSSQQNAVCKALATEDIFLIQGPPGTGKTSVIMEIIRQILSRHPKDQILISSQSNIAVDNVLTRLSKINSEQQHIRLLRIGREEKIEDEARQFEIEKAINEWQKKIRENSAAHWQKYESQHEKMLLGVKKLSNIESIRKLREQVGQISNRITQAVNLVNSELIISPVNNEVQLAAEDACELIYEKLLLDEKILNLIKDYVDKFGIEFPEKQQLLNWIEQEYSRLQTILGDSNEKYEKFVKLKELKEEWNERLQRKQRDLVPMFLDGVNVIGATCLGVANLKDIKFDWVIVDEAGRSTAPETFVPMSKGKKIILVGDHKQLPPIIDRELLERAFSEQEIQKKVLETSLFEYLYEKLPNGKKITLNNQYRMHPDIGKLVSTLFYEGQVSSELVNLGDKQHQLTQFDKNIYWVTTSNVKPIDQIYERSIGTSYTNRYEANLIKAILEKIEQDCQSSGVQKTVGVIAGYASQISTLETVVATNDQNIWKNLHIVVHTVDAFQGRECDIIIYDLVRSNKKKKLGFTSDYRRLNVALSRAQQLLIIVGNDVMAYEGKAPKKLPNPFQKLIEYIDINAIICYPNTFE